MHAVQLNSPQLSVELIGCAAVGDSVITRFFSMQSHSNYKMLGS